METSKPAQRVPLSFGVEYRRNYARDADPGNLKNLSLSGAFLIAEPRMFAPNDKVKIYINVGGRKRRLNATVVWTGVEGVGISFDPSNNQDVQIIDDLLYFVENQRASRRDVLDAILTKVS